MIPGTSIERSCHYFKTTTYYYNMKEATNIRYPTWGSKEQLERTRNLPTTIAVADFVLPDNVLEDVNDNEVGELIDKNFDGVFDFGVD
jgi:hypothetical protein